MATVMLISDTTRKILQIPFTVGKLSGSLENNKLVLKIAEEATSNFKQVVSTVVDDIINEIEKRKSDIIKLEEDLKILNSKIEKNYNTADEMQTGSEYIILLGLISKHKTNIDLLKMKEKEFSYTKLETIHVIRVEPGVITKLPDGFCGYDHVVYSKSDISSVVDEKSIIETSITKNVTLTCKYKINDVIYYREDDCSWSKCIIKKIYDNIIIVYAENNDYIYKISSSMTSKGVCYWTNNRISLTPM